VSPAYLSRRALLLSPLAALSCGPPKAAGFLGYCFVANQQGRSVSVVDLYRHFRTVKRIPLGAAPSAVLRHPSQQKVLVLTPDAGTVVEIDAASLSVSRRARMGNQAVAMQLAPRGDALWVLYRDPAALVELPLESFRPARRIRLNAPPEAFDLTGPESLERRAAVISPRDRSIAIASLDRAQIERVIPAGAEPALVRFRKDGKQVITGNAIERSLGIFDTESGKTVVRLPLPLAPRHFAVDSTGGQLFVSGDGMDAVAIVFPYTTEIWQTVLAGRAPGAMMTVETPGSHLLVANPETNSLTVLDLNTQKLVAVVQVGQEPCQILMTPAKDANQQYILVVNRQSGDLAVIRNYSLNSPLLGSKPWLKSAPLFTMIPVGEGPVSAAVLPLA
jgi:YVTN family beta-propeller protein